MVTESSWRRVFPAGPIPLLLKLRLLKITSRGLSTVMTAILPLPFLAEWRPMLLTSRSEAFPDPCTGARRLVVPKWFVPGGVKAAGGKGSPSE